MSEQGIQDLTFFHYSPQKYAMMSLQALCGGGCLYGVDCSLKAVQMFDLQVGPGSPGGRHSRKIATAENTRTQHTLFKGNKFPLANIIFKSGGQLWLVARCAKAVITATVLYRNFTEKEFSGSWLFFFFFFFQVSPLLILMNSFL